MFRLAASLLALATVATPAIAQAAPDAPPRLSVQGDVGLNAILPTYEFQVGYRLPTLDDRLEVFAGYAPPSPSLATGSYFNVARAGVRFFLIPRGAFQTFLMASADGVFETNGYNTLGASLGVGADGYLTPNLALTGAISASYPMLFRPQLGLKLLF